MALNLIPGREAKWQVGAAIIFASHRAQLVTAIEVVLENFQGGSAWRTLAMNMSNLLEEERGDGSEGRVAETDVRDPRCGGAYHSSTGA